MMIVPGSLGRLGAIASAIAQWLPSGLFTTGVNGAWYDPSDLTTLYQDAAGATPVTAVGQPVGLMLDKSKGLVLGPELVTNGNFSNGATGWTLGSGWTVVSGVAKKSTVGTANAVSQSVGVSANKFYRVLFTVSELTAGSVNVRLGGTATVNFSATANGTYSIVIPSAGIDAFVYFYSGSTFDGAIDNISVRELPGNHAFNPSGNSANFPVLSARYNLLTKTETLTDSSVWQQLSNATVAANGNYFTISDNNTTSASFIRYTTTSPAGTYTLSLICKKQTVFTSCARLALDSINGTSITFNPATGAFALSAGATGGVVDTNDGNFTITITATLAASPSPVIAPAVSTNPRPTSVSATFSATGFLDVCYPDLRVANDALNQPTYQRVNTATDYDTVGFKPYLSFNGVNQWLQTNSIDFTYGDNMFVSAGVRKLSDSATGILIEFSTAYNNVLGTFAVAAPSGAGSNSYRFISGGTIAGAGLAGTGVFAAAPITNIVSGIGSISSPSAALRVDGTQVAQSTASQGVGNYGNYQLYLGARAGTSLFYNGRLYGLVVAGKSASASEIASTEAWLNQKTGAY